jgi:hypothetical protein
MYLGRTIGTPTSNVLAYFTPDKEYVQPTHTHGFPGERNTSPERNHQKEGKQYKLTSPVK